MIENEILSGSGTSWALANTPAAGTVALFAGGLRLTPGVGNDYVIIGSAITTTQTYPAGSLLADYTAYFNPSPSIIGTDRLSPFALTTLQRVKDLLFDPGLTYSITGTLTNNSTNVSSITVQTAKTVRIGQIITGTGIPAGTTIAAYNSGAGTITLSQAATTGGTETLYVIDQPTAYDAVLIRAINWATNYINNECGRPGGFVQQTYVNDTYSIDNPRQSFLLLRNTPVFSLTSLQWRAGTPSNPNWTDFIADQFELVDPRTDPISGVTWYPSGQVRVYGVLPGIYSNMIRATYVAGYPVNWANPEDHNTHWLPGDLTNVCENLVVRRFTRRQLAGKSSDRIGEASTSYRNALDQEDLDVLGQYRQLNF